MLHVWNIYLHWGDFWVNVGKYSSTMEHMGLNMAVLCDWKVLAALALYVYTSQWFLVKVLNHTLNNSQI